MVDKTVRSFFAEQLRRAAMDIDPKHGMVLENISKIALNDTIQENLLNCIQSTNQLDISDGLYFLMGLLQKSKLGSFGDDFIETLIERIPILITVNQSVQVRTHALQFYVWLKDNYPDYRETMIEFLRSDDLTQKKCALNNYETFYKPEEIEPLLIFENDQYVAELSMCGPLEYQLRNLALDKISKVLNKNFMINEIKEKHFDWGNVYVSWYDWSPFLEWYQKKSKKSIFGRKK